MHQSRVMPPKYRLVIQRDPESGACEPYLLELARLRFFLNGSYVPVWTAPPRSASGAYRDIEITVRPNASAHFYRLMTGGEIREQKMSESLDFRGMWPQEIYVYIREFQHAVHKYVYDTFQEEILHEERRRKMAAEDRERRRLERQRLAKQTRLRNKEIKNLAKQGQSAFGLAVHYKLSISTIKHILQSSK